NNGDLATIRALVFQGYGGTIGIISTSGQSAGNTILALLDNSQIGAADWNGQSIGANAIIGKYTFFGDMDFDGQVTPGDYGILDANFGTIPPLGIAWIHGDADLDGQVTPGDYGILDAN